MLTRDYSPSSVYFGGYFDRGRSKERGNRNPFKPTDIRGTASKREGSPALKGTQATGALSPGRRSNSSQNNFPSRIEAARANVDSFNSQVPILANMPSPRQTRIQRSYRSIWRKKKSPTLPVQAPALTHLASNPQSREGTKLSRRKTLYQTFQRRRTRKLLEPDDLREMVESTAAHTLPHVPGERIPFSFRSGHFSSPIPEHNELFLSLNKEIQADPKLRKRLELQRDAPDLQLEVFPDDSTRLKKSFNSFLSEHGDTVYPLISQALQYKEAGFRKADSESPMSRLDQVMGSDVRVNSQSHAPLYLNKLVQEFLTNPKRKQAVKTWRAVNSAKYIKQRATKIKGNWKEWRDGMAITTPWSFAVGTLAKNGLQLVLFRSELAETDFKHLPAWQKVLTGIPKETLSDVLKPAGHGKKTGVVGIGVLGESTVQIPAATFVQIAIRRVEKGLSFKQALKEVLSEKKGETAAAVLAAALGTAPEAARENLWHPATKAGKAGKSGLKFVTNTVATGASALPLFTAGGPQSSAASKLLAQLYNPATGEFMLSDTDRKYLSAPNRTLKDIKKYFDRKAEKEILHVSPGPRMVAAAIPVTAAFSLVPSTLGTIASNALPESGVLSGVIDAATSLIQVSGSSLVELLSFNTTAALDKVAPQVVTRLSKIGRPVLNGVYAPFHYGKRAIHVGASAFDPNQRFIQKPEDPYIHYKAIKNTLQTNTDEMV